MYRKAKELSVLENLKKKGDIKITKYGQKMMFIIVAERGEGKFYALYGNSKKLIYKNLVKIDFLIK